MKRTTVTKKLGTRTKYELPTFQAEPVKLSQAERESVIARLLVEAPELRIIECVDCPFIGRVSEWLGVGKPRTYGCPECGAKLYKDIHPHFVADRLRWGEQ